MMDLVLALNFEGGKTSQLESNAIHLIAHMIKCCELNTKSLQRCRSGTT